MELPRGGEPRDICWRYFRDKGSCLMIDEDKLAQDILYRKLSELYINRQELHRLASKAYIFSSKFHKKNFLEIIQEAME